MTGPVLLLAVALLAILLASLAAAAGLFWSPPDEMPPASELYGRGLHRRDTAFNAGAAHGSEIVTVILVLPAALRALAGPLDRVRLTDLAVLLALALCLGASLSSGAIAFNEAFPLHVLLTPLSVLSLGLVLRTYDVLTAPRWQSALLVACGLWLVACGLWPRHRRGVVAAAVARDGRGRLPAARPSHRKDHLRAPPRADRAGLHRGSRGIVARSVPGHGAGSPADGHRRASAADDAGADFHPASRRCCLRSGSGGASRRFLACLGRGSLLSVAAGTRGRAARHLA